MQKKWLRLTEVRTAIAMRREQLSLLLALLACAGACVLLSVALVDRESAKPTSLEAIVARVVRLPILAEEEGEEGEEGADGEELDGESLRRYLRASADSVAYSCGGKEVAEVCLLSTETCVTSMQKKNKYTVEQTVSRDMATCSCFQSNGCSAGCNAAMMSMFGGYVSVADCPVSTSPFVFSSINPYDVYGGSEFDSVYNDPGFIFSTAGAAYKAMPSQTMLRSADASEPVVLVSPRLRMLAQRKI